MIDAGRRRWWALAALSLTLITVGLDLTVLNVALPTLSQQLHASAGQLQWFADGYNLVLAAVLLPAGLLGDRLGAKRLLVAALAVFGLASLACAYATSPGQLIAGRAALGFGAAFLMPLGMSVLTVLFPGDDRRRALAILVTANTVGIPLGPIVGGWLLDNYWWGSVFLINVPIIAVALVAVFALMPPIPGTGRARLDVPGLLTSSAGLVGVTYGLIEAGEKGWGDTRALATLVVGLALLAGFIWWQTRSSHPLVDLSLFSSAGFTWGATLATLMTFTLFGLLFSMPQFFQAVNGADALGTGLRLLPIIVGMTFGTQVATRLGRRVDPKFLIATGYTFLAVAMFIGATTSVTSTYAMAGIWMGIAGIGLGFTLPAAMNAAMGALNPRRAGTGSALIMAMRQVGGTIGVAILGTVLSSVYRNHLDTGGLPADAATAARRSVTGGVDVARRLGSAGLADSARGAFVDALTTSLIICGAVAVVGVVVTLTLVPRLRDAAPGAPGGAPAPRDAAPDAAVVPAAAEVPAGATAGNVTVQPTESAHDQRLPVE